jgi:hypothetical protein
VASEVRLIRDRKSHWAEKRNMIISGIETTVLNYDRHIGSNDG